MLRTTVVVPVYNDADMLAGCLAALGRQSRPPDRVLVVDNGCTDRSVQLATQAGAEVIGEPRRGILPATAAGFDAATGDVLARVDADSRPPPDWLERLLGHFDQPDPPAAVTGSGRFYGGSRAVQVLGEHLYLGGYFLWVRALLGHPPLYGSNFALRAQVWGAIGDRVHRTDRRVHDDLDISFALRPGMRVVYDRGLTMPVSARPFATFGGAARRIGWGFRTIWVNGRDENLLERRRAVRRAALRAGRAAGRRAGGGAGRPSGP